MIMIPAVVFSLVALISCLPVFASEKPSHPDRTKLPYGCSSCHFGFDFKSGGGTSGCLNCHGGNSSRSQVLVASGADLRNIRVEFAKIYHHPALENRNIHRSNEVLPETDARAPRHADCVDCHNPHFSTPGNHLAGVTGKKVGSLVTTITSEYELCYKCHAESANLPVRSTNKRSEFSTNNPSFHPVEGEGKNTTVISLLTPYKERKVGAADISTIKCTSCHAGDNAEGSRAPHGSNYEHILTDNFTTRDNESESYYSYALCYRCHNRTSILNNESFRYHSLHIKGKGGSSFTGGGTSCHTCHTSHGSTEYKYLIKFNTDIVSSNSKGLLKYVEKGSGSFHGECYLSCHGVDHNPKSY
jgi:hypothetical protein